VTDDDFELMFDLPPEISELEASDEALVVVNLEGVVVLISKPAQTLLGFTAEDAIGEFVEAMMPKAMRWGHQAYRRGYQAQPSDREMDPGLEPHAQRPDGTLVPIASRLEPRWPDGKLFVVAHLTERPGP
jgi:PAS domain S-box-containing protein